MFTLGNGVYLTRKEKFAWGFLTQHLHIPGLESKNTGYHQGERESGVVSSFPVEWLPVSLLLTVSRSFSSALWSEAGGQMVSSGTCGCQGNVFAPALCGNGTWV